MGGYLVEIQSEEENQILFLFVLTLLGVEQLGEYFAISFLVIEYHILYKYTSIDATSDICLRIILSISYRSHQYTRKHPSLRLRTSAFPENYLKIIEHDHTNMIIIDTP